MTILGAPAFRFPSHLGHNAANELGHNLDSWSPPPLGNESRGSPGTIPDPPSRSTLPRYYIHFLGTDKRLNEWVTLDRWAPPATTLLGFPMYTGYPF